MRSICYPLIFLLLIGAACKKKTETTTPVLQKGQLFFHMHTNIDTAEVQYGDTAHLADGRKIIVNLAQLYLSNIRLIKADGSMAAPDNVYVLKTADKEQYLLGDAPAGNYVSVSFNVGIDVNTNHKDPSAEAAGSVLARQNPSMWFGSTDKGYIFVNLEGKTDTTTAKTGPPSVPFKFQIGSDNNLINVRLPDKNFSIANNGAYEVHLDVDYGKLFTGLNPAFENSTATFDNPNLASKIAANIPAMFRYEQ